MRTLSLNLVLFWGFFSECTASCSPDRRTRSLHTSLLANDGAVRRVLAVLLHQSSFSPSTAAAAHKLDMQVLHMLDSSFWVLLCVSFSEIKKGKKIDMYFGQIIFCLLFVWLLTSCCCCWEKRARDALPRCPNSMHKPTSANVLGCRGGDTDPTSSFPKVGPSGPH